ncbi:MAG: hypothetical protein ACKO3J_01625 [Candidatus Nanopelagicus sp.]
MAVNFYLDGANWDAECQEIGLVGYADPDINVVRKNVFDSIKFFLENEDGEFIERFVSIEDLK